MQRIKCFLHLNMEEILIVSGSDNDMLHDLRKSCEDCCLVCHRLQNKLIRSLVVCSCAKTRRRIGHLYHTLQVLEACCEYAKSLCCNCQNPMVLLPACKDSLQILCQQTAAACMGCERCKAYQGPSLDSVMDCVGGLHKLLS